MWFIVFCCISLILLSWSLVCVQRFASSGSSSNVKTETFVLTLAFLYESDAVGFPATSANKTFFFLAAKSKPLTKRVSHWSTAYYGLTANASRKLKVNLVTSPNAHKLCNFTQANFFFGLTYFFQMKYYSEYWSSLPVAHDLQKKQWGVLKYATHIFAVNRRPQPDTD